MGLKEIGWPSQRESQMTNLIKSVVSVSLVCRCFASRTRLHFPDVNRKENREVCSFAREGHTQFAHYYHKTRGEDRQDNRRPSILFSRLRLDQV